MTIQYCDSILRSFTKCCWKAAAQFTSGVFISSRKILQERFSRWQEKAFTQESVHIYNPKTDTAEKIRWSGFNKYSTPDTWLHLAKFKKLNREEAKVKWIDIREGMKSVKAYREKLVPKFKAYVSKV